MNTIIITILQQIEAILKETQITLTTLAQIYTTNLQCIKMAQQKAQKWLTEKKDKIVT